MILGKKWVLSLGLLVLVGCQNFFVIQKLEGQWESQSGHIKLIIKNDNGFVLAQWTKVTSGQLEFEDLGYEYYLTRLESFDDHGFKSVHNIYLKVVSEDTVYFSENENQKYYTPLSRKHDVPATFNGTIRNFFIVAGTVVAGIYTFKFLLNFADR